jgi:hypothetical protein
MAKFDRWVSDFATFVQNKGKVQPGKYRAYGHQWRDIKLGFRYARMMAGLPPKDSSPYEQQMDLNKDVTFSPKKGEGEKLRKGSK